jgi:hypothetical protein
MIQSMFGFFDEDTGVLRLDRMVQVYAVFHHSRLLVVVEAEICHWCCLTLVPVEHSVCPEFAFPHSQQGFIYLAFLGLGHS